MAPDICRLSAIELASLIKKGSLTPLEAVEASLQRVEQVQGRLNCMLALSDAQARKDAEHIHKRLRRGEEVGRLAGVPITVKDLIDTRGIPTTFGSLVFADNVPVRDAVVVQRARDAGAILIGKTTTPEFGLGALTQSPLFGKTANAWDTSRTSGGSSGGAASATAAGVTAIAIGSDGGGSGRIPAACNGIVGFKQSHGVIPHSQSGERFGNISYINPMARSVADTRILFQVLAGGHPDDPLTVGVSATGRDTRPLADLSNKKFYYSLTPRGTPVDPCVRHAFDDALRLIESLGGSVIELPEATSFDAFPPWEILFKTARMAQVARFSDAESQKLGPMFTRQLSAIGEWSALDYQRAVEAKTALFLKVQHLIQDDGFIVTPTTTRTALDIDQDFFGEFDVDGRKVSDLRKHWFPWTMLFNLTGHPAISLPFGLGADGLPLGLQVVGGFRADYELLNVAALIEQTRGQFPEPPPL